MKVEGRSRSVILDCGCDREGRKLSWEARAEEVSFEGFLKDATEGLFLTWKGKAFQRTGA